MKNLNVNIQQYPVLFLNPDKNNNFITWLSLSLKYASKIFSNWNGMIYIVAKD